ncbi:MAG: VWA domain-containing protein [Archaeoglobaceae archaeon]
MTDKPPCQLCEREDGNGIEQIAEDLLYGLFNPYQRDLGKFDVTELIKKHMGEKIDSYEIFSFTFRELMNNFGFLGSYWLEKVEKYKAARQQAWEEFKDMLRKGEIKREDISISQVVENFFEEVVEELQQMGYLEGVEARFHRRLVRYTKVAERALGEKVLEMSLRNLEKRWHGENVTEKEGISIFPGEKLVEFDDFVHSFDSIDVVESLLKSAMRGEIIIDEKDLVARQPKHAEKCVYIMLIDVSDSMRGKKIVGAIEAAIGLKRAIRRKGSVDELRVVAFNHRAWEIKEGEILNLQPRGRTDIGLALRKAREIAKRSSGTPIVFLISDGEPTSSYNPHLTPWRCSLAEAEKLRSVDARLQIIMLGKEGRFLELCKAMARLCGKSNLIHVADPLNLKRFIVRSYMRR